jgi:EmrB/QacA subfamily drug resistance transporter
MDRRTQNMILVVTTVGGFLATFMASSINIAIKAIEAEFSASAVLLGWIPTAYVLATGAVLMTMGRIADLRGRNRVFMVGMGGFAVVTFAAALAPSTGVLIVLRVFQGVFAAMLFSTNIAMIALSHPAEVRGRALGTLVTGVYLGMTLGPVLGGVITRNAGWRILFVVVGAISLADFLLVFWKLRRLEWREPKTARFDVVGSVMWAIALSAFLLGLSYLPAVTGVVLVVAGFLGLGLFFWWETKTEDPILNVDLFRKNRVFAFSNLAALINYSATAALVFLMSLYLQYNRGLDAQDAGLLLIPGLFVQAVLSAVAGRLSDRFSARILASAGMALAVVALLALAFLSETTPYWYVIGMLCILGIGLAFFATPIAHVVMGSVEKHQVGTASATIATMRLIGQSLSMGLATLVLAIVVGRHVIKPADYPGFLTSTRITFAIFAGLCVVGVAASLVGPKRQQEPEPAHVAPPAPPPTSPPAVP